jgi:putative sigma-54 modulation protein
MHISFTGHNIDVTQALKTFTEEKLNKLERHFDKINSIHVVFDIEHLTQVAEASIQVAKGELHARAESDDLYSAIDALIDKLDRQLIKYKEKIRDHRN